MAALPEGAAFDVDALFVSAAVQPETTRAAASEPADMILQLEALLKFISIDCDRIVAYPERTTKMRHA